MEQVLRNRTRICRLGWTMNLHDHMSNKKAAILDRWFDLILESYPADSSHFLKSKKDRFANPVGQTIARGTGALFEGLLEGADPGRLAPPLEEIVKIRAVQDFPPSEALHFVFLLKRAIREILDAELRGGALAGELAEFESVIDRLGLQAFDLYMGCKATLYEIRAREHRRRAYKLWERAGMSVTNPEQEKDLK
jgi:hypothetical protein